MLLTRFLVSESHSHISTQTSYTNSLPGLFSLHKFTHLILPYSFFMGCVVFASSGTSWFTSSSFSSKFISSEPFLDWVLTYGPILSFISFPTELLESHIRAQILFYQSRADLIIFFLPLPSLRISSFRHFHFGVLFCKYSWFLIWLTSLWTWQSIKDIAYRKLYC